MISYQSAKSKKELIAYFDLTGVELLFSERIVPLQNKVPANQYYFNPDLFYKDVDNLYKLKKDIQCVFNIINNVSNFNYDFILGFKKNLENYYIFYDIGGINKGETGYYSKNIFLLKDSYFTIFSGFDFIVQKRYYYGDINTDSYHGLLIYFTEN